jgi:hypothetical protein
VGSRASYVPLEPQTGERLAALCLHEQVIGEAMIGLHRNFGLPDFPSDYVGERSWQALGLQRRPRIGPRYRWPRALRASWRPVPEIPALWADVRAPRPMC